MAYDKREIQSYIDKYEAKVIDNHEAMLTAIEQGRHDLIKGLAETLKFYADELYEWSIKESEEDIESREYRFTSNDRI